MVNDIAQKEMDIMGGLKNALSRGENLDTARKSFINAGYSPQIVNMAARKIGGVNIGFLPGASPQGMPGVRGSNVPLTIDPVKNLNLHATRPVQPQQLAGQLMAGQRLQVNQQRQIPKKKFLNIIPYWAVVLMILLAFAIVVGASVLGVFWDQIFKL